MHDHRRLARLLQLAQDFHDRSFGRGIDACKRLEKLFSLIEGEIEILQVEQKIRSEQEAERSKINQQQANQQIAKAIQTNVSATIVEIAKRIAKAIRFSSGGFRYVKSMGVPLASRNQ